jgi:hypothetical protein
MNPNTPEIRIMELEKKVNALTDMLSSILMNSNSTKISFKNEVQFSKIGKVGFFGKTPVGQQTLASDTLANLLTALRTLGLIT